ncbi:hypothetical protein PybrP1_002749 [[Pythium] brassicae (nom. inval.)]|nr:hypothetical protein PybrP1_002749 [[Pythium] brassicae (nom. inval.)]
MSMWNKLFSEAPPGAVEQLLSPKRKLYYGLLAFAPGTLLALFLSSVKRHMDRENEELRQQHIAEEMREETEREQKDMLLINMIQDLRSRLQALEKEVTDKKLQQVPTDAAVDKQAPAAVADWEQQKAAFLLSSGQSAKPAAAEAQSGINARIQQRERAMVREDVRAFKAARAAAAASDTTPTS